MGWKFIRSTLSLKITFSVQQLQSLSETLSSGRVLDQKSSRELKFKSIRTVCRGVPMFIFSQLLFMIF